MHALILRQAVLLLLLLTLLTGPLYTLSVTGLAQALFPWRANGSLLKSDGRVVGSELIGQEFESPRYFWSRPSATTPMPYNAALSAGSNFGPLNPSLFSVVAHRMKALQTAGLADSQLVPVDLVTASGSGLDPHIGVASALLQVDRVAHTRQISSAAVLNEVARATSGRQFGFLGEPRVNVLRLNLALDAIEGRMVH